ncbi:hypothetical protein YPPY102_0968, partial [Yersinia pestis PY-102]
MALFDEITLRTL